MPSGFSWSELGVDSARIHVVKEAELPSGRREFVLYWCMVNHRAEENHALDAALALGNHLGLPVVVYLALRPDYPHASERLHAWALEGMSDVAAGCASRGVPCWMELPRTADEHVARLAELGRRAAIIVSDLFPTFIIPGHLHGAARAVQVPLVAVDASCVVPMQRVATLQAGAYTLRPKLQKLWPEYLGRILPARKPKVSGHRLHPEFEPADARAAREALGSFDIDHDVKPLAERGGRKAGLDALRTFLQSKLEGYDTQRNDPGHSHQSNLSPFFHWGNLFAGEAARAAIRARGTDHPAVRSFLEELLVRRELGFNYCLHTPVPRQLSVESLPAWARDTLSAHQQDRREHLYTREDLAAARTADGLWNAAQRELRERGRIHNYLRMLWGKKILEWSPTPQQALERIAWLNDKYAVDGRDPSSVANFMWVLGLHDRPFQERKVLGKVRPMSSLRTADKYDLGPYLARWARPEDAPVKIKRVRRMAAD
ncbi:deoxyribodipyrimidine photo-lyase [Corallococcus sp. H22C18031201]|uniref:deoxyribodipyrimidine photo-lyase n=1 Tax=Citreicoccus inhibens TaxID=2849499 RepID=UPI000E72248C|nr:deoxyribodipyrimidine photo-lyase [Citreicoccus inhibens]MBU8894483.1 deoxyribodipyrimidine photo-lyase [Citreicoccus inhibens]RJS25086.1 deoxyribodipyrimidine photo-lyase [Corallococcus sp. H22C18031201]